MQKIFTHFENQVTQPFSHGTPIADEEISLLDKRSANVENGHMERRSTGRQKLTSKMRTDDTEQPNYKDSFQRPSRRRQSSFEETVPASLRATRTSNRIATKSSPIRKAKSPSPVKFSIAYGLGPQWKKYDFSLCSIPSLSRADSLLGLFNSHLQGAQKPPWNSPIYCV